MELTFRGVKSPEDLQFCLDIRFLVFVEEQKVPLELEVDEYDEVAMHVLGLADGLPAATLRLRFVEDKIKIERFAVLKDYRSQGVGAAMMVETLKLIEGLKERMQITKAVLSAQEAVIPFYQKFGFSVCSDTYMDANIPHKDMELSS